MLEAVAGAKSLAGILVVTLAPEATAFASRLGARVVTDGARDGHTGSVTAGLKLLAREGRGGMMTVPADIPAATSAEFDRVVAAHLAAPSFTISPAHDDLGSNAVICSPPDLVPLRFGDNSYFPHLDAARRCGIEPTVSASPASPWTSTIRSTWRRSCACRIGGHAHAGVSRGMGVPKLLEETG